MHFCERYGFHFRILWTAIHITRHAAVVLRYCKLSTNKNAWVFVPKLSKHPDISLSSWNPFTTGSCPAIIWIKNNHIRGVLTWFWHHKSRLLSINTIWLNLDSDNLCYEISWGQLGTQRSSRTFLPSFILLAHLPISLWCGLRDTYFAYRSRDKLCWTRLSDQWRQIPQPLHSNALALFGLAKPRHWSCLPLTDHQIGGLENQAKTGFR